MNAPWYLTVWHLARNLIGIFMGTAAIVGFGFVALSQPMRIGFAAAALAILMPPNAFPGATMLDWIGLGGAVAVLGVNYLRSLRQPQQPASA